MERQYCASSYVIDFDEAKILLMYNKKLKKWLQPGGHIEGVETPIEACVREVKEETGIDIKIVGYSFFEHQYQPIAVERYINRVGDMIDIQYLSIPLNKNINSSEGNEVRWVDINNLESMNDVDSEIKVKVLSLYKGYNDRK